MGGSAKRTSSGLPNVWSFLSDTRHITHRAIGDIADSGSQDELASVVQHHLSKLGFMGFTCTSFRAAGGLAVHSLEFSTMPPDFVKAFVSSQLLMQDPVTRRARQESRPFFWGEEDHDLLLEPHRQISRLRDNLGVQGGCCAMIAERIGAQPAAA